MRFNKENIGPSVLFSEIEEGELFEHSSIIYLKIDEVESDEWGRFNAVDISTGELSLFDYDGEVFRADANLTVKVFK